MVKVKSIPVKKSLQNLNSIDVAVSDYTSALELIPILAAHPHINRIYFPEDPINQADLSEWNAALFPINKQQFIPELNKRKINLFFVVKKDEKLCLQNLKSNIPCIDITFKGTNEIYVPEGPVVDSLGRANYLRIPGPVSTAIVLGLLPFTKISAFFPVAITAIIPPHLSAKEKGQTDEEIIAEVKKYFKDQFSVSFQMELDRWTSQIKNGVFISSTFYCPFAIEELRTLYNDFFIDSPFVGISEQPIYLQQVVGTNHCFIHFEKAGEKLIVHSTIDDRLKGSAGQAVQIMNRLFKWKETAGLEVYSPLIPLNDIN